MKNKVIKIVGSFGDSHDIEGIILYEIDCKDKFIPNKNFQIILYNA